MALFLPICSCKSKETSQLPKESEENTSKLYKTFSKEYINEEFESKLSQSISSFLELQNSKDFTSCYKSETECSITTTVEEEQIIENEQNIINKKYQYDSDADILDYYERQQIDVDSNYVDNQHYYYQLTQTEFGCYQIDLINNSILFLASYGTSKAIDESLEVLNSIEEEIEKLDFMELIFTIIPDKSKILC